MVHQGLDGATDGIGGAVAPADHAGVLARGGVALDEEALSEPELALLVRHHHLLLPPALLPHHDYRLARDPLRDRPHVVWRRGR